MNIKLQFFKYVSQNIFGMLGVSCYILADTFFISRAAGANGITVLNLVLPVYGIIFAIGSMIGVGSATRYSIVKAQKDESADCYFSNAIFCILVISIPFVVLGIFFPHKVLALMGGDAQIVSVGISYTRIFLLFAPCFMLNYVIPAFVRNDNDPTLAMLGTMTGSFSNIILDYLLMFPFKMGLPGAALATAVSPLISMSVCSLHFLKRTNHISFRWKLPSVKKLFVSCQLGISAFVGEISSAVTTTLFNFLILGLAGNIGVAAYGVVANLALVATAIFNGISQGTQPLFSKTYGDGKKEDIKKLLRLSLITAFVISLVLLAAAWYFCDSFVAVFNSEHSAELAEYAQKGLKIYFIGYLFAGPNIVCTGFFGATEKAKEAFITSMLRGFAAIAACSCIFSAIFGMTGVWASFVASEFITGLVCIFYVCYNPNTV